jgi:hypothetical protein
LRWLNVDGKNNTSGIIEWCVVATPKGCTIAVWGEMEMQFSLVKE